MHISIVNNYYFCTFPIEELLIQNEATNTFMSEYRIGFYVQPVDDFWGRLEYDWLLSFDGTGFSFRIIDESLLPAAQDNPLINYKRYPYQSFGNPVLYREDASHPQNPIIEEIVFLREIPIRAMGELCNSGYEIYAPFIKRQDISNPCLTGYLGICDFTKEDVIESSLFLNGEEIVCRLPGQEEVMPQSQKNQVLFNHLVIAEVVIDHIYAECESFERYSAFLHKPYHHYNYCEDKKPSHDKGIGEIIKYVEALDIATIVDSISADITYDHSYYRHEIDGSYYTLHIRIPDEYEQLRNDCYLSSHLRGFVLRDDDYHKTGPVEKHVLQKIKFDLYKNYSKTEHIACLVAEWQSYAFHLCYYKYLWKDFLSIIESPLRDYFLRHKIFSEKYQKTIEARHNYANQERLVEIINEGVKASTECNLDREVFDECISDIKTRCSKMRRTFECHDSKYSHDYPPGVWHVIRSFF